MQADELGQAIISHAATEGLTDAGDVIGDWVVVACMTNLEDSGKDGYVMLYSRSPIPDHIAEGLLRRGIYKLYQDYEED